MNAPPCPHEVEGLYLVQFCRVCGDVLIGNDWIPGPGTLQRIKNAEAEVARQGELLVSIEHLTGVLFDERDRLRDALALVEQAMAGRDRMQEALIVADGMMATMHSPNGPTDPPYQALWEQFEIMLANLRNDGLLDVVERTANG
jgi:hypothetical protein